MQNHVQNYEVVLCDIQTGVRILKSMIKFRNSQNHNHRYVKIASESSRDGRHGTVLYSQNWMLWSSLRQFARGRHITGTTVQARSQSDLFFCCLLEICNRAVSVSKYKFQHLNCCCVVVRLAQSCCSIHSQFWALINCAVLTCRSSTFDVKCLELKDKNTGSYRTI